ncbi:hypothetical protein [Ornithinicoccus halotolerans]|uniref:hypothetical protein n=1 Tax=Ornithinicoccus halotolerans TaxID=1748220 RepID=UPI001295C0C8|nr:hypothetical protein [Ornithinicoccus halotolerans]
MSRWGQRALAGVIALQIAVPAVALTLEPPTRFGWQMYSGYDGELVVLGADGEALEYDVSALFAKHPRPELDWESRVVEELCRHVEGASSVAVTQGRQDRKVVPCG